MIAGGQGEIPATGRGEETGVRHLQATVLAQLHRLLGDAVIQVITLIHGFYSRSSQARATASPRNTSTRMRVSSASARDSPR